MAKEQQEELEDEENSGKTRPSFLDTYRSQKDEEDEEEDEEEEEEYSEFEEDEIAEEEIEVDEKMLLYLKSILHQMDQEMAR